MKSLLTVAEVADRYSVTEETVRRWIRSGKIKASRIGTRGDFRITEQALKGAQISPTVKSTGIIAFVNLKGGVGKTTSSIYTAAAAASLGQKVIVLDADPESSATNWATTAMANQTPLPFQVIRADSDRLAKQARDLSVDQVVIIDTPPNLRDFAMQAAGVSGVCVVPLTPTGIDVDRFISTALLLEQVEQFAELNVRLLITRAKRNEILTREMGEHLKDFPLMSSRIHDAVDYRGAFGATPQNLDEYEGVWLELAEEMRR